MSRILGLVDGSLHLLEQSATCQVCFQPQERVFVGHFPGNPIVPGVLMLEGLVALHACFGAAMTGVKEAKFRAIARPLDLLTYTISKDGIGAVVHASGEVVLSCKLTLGIGLP